LFFSALNTSILPMFCHSSNDERFLRVPRIMNLNTHLLFCFQMIPANINRNYPQ
jgi:hypothetical protein